MLAAIIDNVLWPLISTDFTGMGEEEKRD